MTIRTRFAPSPTGNVHIGNIRAAIYNWLFSRHEGGEFLLRIEDTDLERSTPAAVQTVLDSLAWLGLDVDGEPVYQSHRQMGHLEVAEQLLSQGAAYKEDKGGTGKGECVIFKMPGTDIAFHDEVKGDLSKKAEDLKDFVIVRSDGSPVFHLGNVVDDITMGITHVIRGDDHVENTFIAQRLFDISLQVQAGWLDGLDASFQGQAAWSQEVTWTRYESHAERSQSWNYVYDTLGNPFFPTAPYEMTVPDGFGPLISDRPLAIEASDGAFTSTDRVAGRKRKTALSRVDLETEGSLLVLTFGPRLRFRPLERLAILVQGGATANLLDVELSRTETFAWADGQVIQTWTDRADEQEWLWGATLSAGVQFDITKNLYLTAAGGYDWVERASFVIGPDRIRYDLDGWRAEAAIGWRFGGISLRD